MSTDGTWYHVALVASGTQVQLYLDGELQGSSNDFYNLLGDRDNSFIVLGNNHWDPNYAGLMDELRIYDRALTAEEVATLAGEADD